MTKHHYQSLFLLLQKELLEQHLYSEKLEPVEHFDDDVVNILIKNGQNGNLLRDARYDFRRGLSSNTKAKPARKEKSKTTGMTVEYKAADPREDFETFMLLLQQSTDIPPQQKIEIILAIGTVLSKGDGQTVRYMDSYNRTMIETIGLALEELKKNGVTPEETQQIIALEAQLATLKGNKTIDRSNITDAFIVAGAVVLFPFVLAYQALDKPKRKSKKEQEKERQEAIDRAKAQTEQNLQNLHETIDKQRKEREDEARRQINESSKPKPINTLPKLNPEKKINLDLHAIVKQLLGYKNDEVPITEQAFAKAVNTIVTSNDAQEQQKNFWIMLDPVHAGTLQRFLTNLAASNIDDRGIGDNLQGKIKTFTGPLVETKLDAANGGQPSYRDSEVKMIQLDLALHIAQWNKTHPGSGPKNIPAPYRRSKGDTLGYPDIFKTISGKEVADKDKVKILDITRYIYAMEEQEIFDEKATDGKNIMPQDIFYYLSVLPERDQQRDVVVTLAHKHRTIKKLQVTLKDRVEPKKIHNPGNIEVPTHFNYRQYLFQLINEQLLPPLPKDKNTASLNDPNTQEQPESDEVIIRKYLYYLINLWENDEFQARYKRLQNSVVALQNASSGIAGEVKNKAKAAEQAYQELTALLKQNNGTRQWLYQILGAPTSFGTFIIPTKIPFNSDDPKEKELFERYKTIYSNMSALEQQLHKTNIQLAQKKGELFGHTYYNQLNWFDKTIDPQYQLSFSDRTSKLPDMIDNLNSAIDSNCFDIKNKEGTLLRQIRTVDVYNQVSNREPFVPLKHISIPTMGDADEILAVFGNNRSNVSAYLKEHGKQPSLNTRTVNMRYGEGEHVIATESPDSDSYHQKQLQALCGLLHRLTIPGYGTYIIENIADDVFPYLLDRELVLRDEPTTLQKTKRLLSGGGNAKLIFLPQKLQDGPYQIEKRNIYLAKIDAAGAIGITDLPPRNPNVPARSNPEDPFLYRKLETVDSVAGYKDAIKAQEQRQLILDNDPYLQQAESIFLDAKGRLEPLVRMLELYNTGKNGDESLTTSLAEEVKNTGTFFFDKQSSGKSRREELSTAAAHIRIYIGKYKVNPYDPMVGPYEATVLKFQAIEKELRIFDSQKSDLFTNRTTTRDSEALYVFLKTLLVIAGTIGVTILTGGTGLPFLTTAAISVAGGMAVGRVVDEGRYYYMNHITPVSFPTSSGNIAMDYTKRSDLMDAAEGRRTWGEVLGQMGPEFGMGMFWYMLGSGLIKVGNGGLARFQKGLQERIGASGTNPQLQATYRSIDNRITKKLSQHIDILESPGMRSFFKQFGHEFGEELTEEGLGDIGQKLGGEYGGPVGAIIEAAIGIRAGNRYRAGQVDIWPSFNRRTATGTESTVYFRNPVVGSGETSNRQLIIDQLGRNTNPETGAPLRSITPSEDGSFIATGIQTGSDGITYTNTIHFIGTEAPAGMLNIQHDPELSAYHIIEQGNTEEEGRTVRNYQAIIYNDGNGPSQADWTNLLRYQNMIVTEESENMITAHDAEGNIVHIQLVLRNAETVDDGNPNTVEMDHYKVFDNPSEAFGISPFNTCIGIIVVEPTARGNKYHVAHIGYETDPGKIDVIIGGMGSIENKPGCQAYLTGGRNMADDHITLSQTEQFRTTVQGTLTGYGFNISPDYIYRNENTGGTKEGTRKATVTPNTGTIAIVNDDSGEQVKQRVVDTKPIETKETNEVDSETLQGRIAKINKGEIQPFADGNDSWVYKIEHNGKQYVIKQYKPQHSKTDIDQYYAVQTGFASYLKDKNWSTPDGTSVSFINKPILLEEHEQATRAVLPFVEGENISNDDPRIQEIQKALENYIHEHNSDSQVNSRHIQALNIKITPDGLVVTDAGGNIEYFLYDAMTGGLIPLSRPLQIAQEVGFDISHRYPVFYQTEARRRGDLPEAYRPIITSIKGLSDAKRQQVAEYVLHGLTTTQNTPFRMNMTIPGGIIIGGIPCATFGQALITIAHIDQTPEGSSNNNRVEEYKEGLLTQLLTLYLPGKSGEGRVQAMKKVLMERGIITRSNAREGRLVGDLRNIEFEGLNADGNWSPEQYSTSLEQKADDYRRKLIDSGQITESDECAIYFAYTIPNAEAKTPGDESYVGIAYDPVTKSWVLFKDYQLTNLANRSKDRNLPHVQEHFVRYLEKYHAFMGTLGNLPPEQRTVQQPVDKPRQMTIKQDGEIQTHTISQVSFDIINLNDTPITRQDNVVTSSPTRAKYPPLDGVVSSDPNAGSLQIDPNSANSICTEIYRALCNHPIYGPQFVACTGIKMDNFEKSLVSRSGCLRYNIGISGIHTLPDGTVQLSLFITDLAGDVYNFGSRLP